MVNDILLLVLSFMMLFFGADFALDGSEKIGERLGMSPLLIGMLLVGIGTSLPELFVSHIATIDGKPDIAIGGLVGSNIANIYLILGICSFIVPMSLSGKDLRPQLIMHLILYLVAMPLLLQKELGFLAAGLLLGYIAFYLRLVYLEMKKESHTEEIKKEDLPDYNYPFLFGKMLVGFVLLFYGGDVLVTAGSSVCKSFGISEYIISAILVAFGTSFPELITALISAMKKKDADLIVGNIIGSNIFNLGLIMGSIAPYKIPINMNLTFEFILLFFASIYMLGLSYRNLKLNRYGGILFLALYAKMVYQWVK